MDKQAIVNQVYPALLQQGPAYNPTNGTCVYRGTNARGETIKCAVGMLIPDDKYLPEFEGESALHWRVVNALGLETSMPLVDFLRDLQRAHDAAASDSAHAFRHGTVPDMDAEFRRIFIERMKALAAEYDLVLPEVSDVV